MLSNAEKRGAFRFYLTAAMLSLVFFGISLTAPFQRGRGGPGPEEMTAFRLMQQALQEVRREAQSRGLTADPEQDPNETFLIGPRISGITTTLGNPEAKRSTTNPRFAALLVRLLKKAGLGPGDRVGIGSSGSFPGLMIASVCAARALGARPVVILSLGSSSFGASREDFNMIHIYRILERAGIFPDPPAAVSLGGSDDRGKDFSDEARVRLERQLVQSGLPFIQEKDLSKNVELRMQILQPDSLAAFVNCGGSYANLGSSSLILTVKPGLVRKSRMPPPGDRGMVFAMLDRGVPVIHLLFIKGLVQRYNLSWDPVPLPDEPGGGEEGVTPVAAGLAAFYLTALGILVFLIKKSSAERPQPSLLGD